MKLILSTLLLVSATVPAPAASSCIVPTVASANVDNVGHDGGLNHYRIAIVVSNKTNATQASSTLQFVKIFKNREKLDAIGIPPLRPGASYKAYYTFARSSEGGDGTTTLDLSMDMVQPACPVTVPSRTITF